MITFLGLGLMLIATLIQAQVLPIVLPQLVGADLRPICWCCWWWRSP